LFPAGCQGSYPRRTSFLSWADPLSLLMRHSLSPPNFFPFLFKQGELVFVSTDAPETPSESYDLGNFSQLFFIRGSQRGIEDRQAPFSLPPENASLPKLMLLLRRRCPRKGQGLVLGLFFFLFSFVERLPFTSIPHLLQGWSFPFRFSWAGFSYSDPPPLFAWQAQVTSFLEFFLTSVFFPMVVDEEGRPLPGVCHTA